MYRLRLITAYPLLLLVALAGCEEGTGTAPEAEIHGSVTVEGDPIADIAVELTGPQTRTGTTDSDGRYSFEDVPSGAFVVSVRNAPEDVSFPATSQTVVVAGSQVEFVDFLGDYIRTASISGSVMAGSQGLAGVSVELSGAESKEVVTGDGGSFQFTGLRAGAYDIEISGYPPSITFPSTRTTVDLSTGESRLATFEGSAELTASVVIRSLERRTASGATEPADPRNLRGVIDVTLTVDRGEDTVSSVELLLGGEVVGEQIFDGSAPVPGLEAAGPLSTAPFDLVISVNTAEFDEESGDVRFENGPRLLTARLETEEGGPSAWLASVPVELRNVNTFTGSLISERGPLPGQDGAEWVGGALTVEVIPVLYDPTRSVGSVTVGLRRAQGTQLRVATQTGGAPFHVVFDDEPPSGSGNVAGYQTSQGSTDQFRVLSGMYEGGGAVAGVPVTIVSDLRVDNVAPQSPSFGLPAQSAEHDCCLGNWVGADFEFLDGVELGSDAGVADVGATIHAGDAALSDQEIAALPEILLGGDLPATPGNSAYRAVAVARDALGNAAIAPLTPTPENALANPSGAVFGVDVALPSLDFTPASVPDGAVNPADGSAWVVSVGDAESGAGPMPVRATVRLSAPGVGGGTAEGCPFPGTAACEPTEDGLAHDVPDGVEGYLTYEAVGLDRAGNRSSARSRIVLEDETAPTIPSITQLPGSVAPAAPAPFAALVSDNVDLHRGWMALQFEADGGGSPPIVAPVAPADLGTPFDGNVTPSATLSQSVPVVIGLEEVAPAADAHVPSGAPHALAALRIVVVDAAGNVGVRTSALDGVDGLAEVSPRSFSFMERGEVGGVGDWTLEADTDAVCRQEDDECPAGTPATVTLTATAAGNEGHFEKPFARVYFLLVREGEPRRIGSTDAAALAEGTGPLGRRWSWTFGWSPGEDVAPGPVELIAVGVDAEGNALQTLVLDSVTVED